MYNKYSNPLSIEEALGRRANIRRKLCFRASNDGSSASEPNENEVQWSGFSGTEKTDPMIRMIRMVQ